MQLSRWRRPILPAVFAGLGLILGLSACGSPPPDLPNTDVPAEPVMSPVTPPTKGGPTAQELLDRLSSVASSLQHWTGIDTSMVEGPDGQPTSYTTQVALLRTPGTDQPTLSSIVLACSDASQVGTKLVWDGGEKVHIKTKVAGLVWIKIDISPTDSKMLDSYGRSLSDTGFATMMKVIYAKGAQYEVKGEASFGSATMQMLDIRSPASWTGVTHELFGIDERTGFLILRDQYNATGKVFDHWAETEQVLDGPLPANAFALD